VRAVKLAHSARVHVEAGDVDEALALLKEAWRACPDARLRHAQGKVLRQAGRPAEALAAFRACVDEGDEADGVLCAPEIAAVEAALAQGVLVVACDVHGARVALDDEAPRPPGRFDVPAGRHSLTITADGWTPLRGVVDVRGGDEVRFEANLAMVPVVEAPAAPVVPIGRADAAAVPSATWPHWLGVGLGSVLVLASAVPFGQYALDRADAREASGTYSGDRVSPTNLVLGSALAGVGLSALVTAVALWPGAPAVTLLPLPGGGAAALGGTW
jgi:hypothetical protein